MFLSIITPTYNRGYTLHRVYDSLMSQTDYDFEWIVVDDGSVDDTKKYVESVVSRSPFPIVLIENEFNIGKVKSLNRAYPICRGEYSLVFDSDDWCEAETVERFKEIISQIAPDQRHSYSGASVLKRYKDGNIVGDTYPIGAIESYVERYNFPVKGDKWDLIRTDVANEFLFPEIPGERYLAPSYMLLNIGRKYKTVFSNVTLGIVEYMVDGISRNNLSYRCGNPIGCTMMYKLIYDISVSPAHKVKARINYWRFYFLGGKFYGVVLFDMVSMPIGGLLFLIDRVRLQLTKMFKR